MNRAQLIRDIATRNGTTLNRAEESLDQVLDSIVRNVVAGEPVALTGFLIIEPVERAERTARNPQTGDKVVVPARPGIRVRVAAGFEEMVTGEREIPETGRANRKAPKGTFTPKKTADAVS